MANTYHQVYIQAVFAVKYRAAVIDETWQNDLFAVIGNLINETGCQTIIVNGVADHVHCFIGLKPTESISDLMKAIKAKSSKWVNETALTPSRFEWQGDMESFPTAVPILKTYTDTSKIRQNITENRPFGKSI